MSNAEGTCFPIKAFVLARNEEANIARTLATLRAAGVSVTVLDSGSADATVAVARAHEGVNVVPYAYSNHCNAYNEITSRLAAEGSDCLIIDADMGVSADLVAECRRLLRSAQPVDVVKAPVQYWVEGRPLEWGSLYPSKAIAFRGGGVYFEPVGHGERLRADVRVAEAAAMLIHDDRKKFHAFLESQARYADAFVNRSQGGQLNWRDWLRARTPVMVVITPLFSYFAKGGILAGKIGLIYALDRVIAEAAMARQALAAKLRSDKSL